MEKKSEKNLMKKLNRLSKVAALAFALGFSSIPSGHADEDAAELLAPEAYAAYPWLYFGCVYNLPQCRSITWNSGYRFFWAQTDLYRCPGHMMACWGTN